MDTAKKTARTLLRANLKDGVSWRQISKYGLREDKVQIQAGIAPGTLCRFAKSKGTWLPKDAEILKKLNIQIGRFPRSPYAIMPRWWARTPEALQHFQYIRDQARTIANETRVSQYAYKKVKQS